MTGDNFDFIKNIHNKIKEDKEKELQAKRETARIKQYGEPLNWNEVTRKKVGDKILCGKFEGVIVKKAIVYVDIQYPVILTRHWRPGCIPYSLNQVIINQYLSGKKVIQLVKQYGFSENSIRRVIKLSGKKKISHWTKEQLQFIRDNFLTMGINGLAVKFNKSTNNIRMKAKELKLFINNENFYWSKEDIKTLIELRDQGYTMQGIADELKLPEHRVRTKMSRLIKQGRIKRKDNHFWTIKEVAQLKRLKREGNRVSQIAKIMNLTPIQVTCKLHKLKKLSYKN